MRKESRYHNIIKMAFDLREDQTAPISLREVQELGHDKEQMNYIVKKVLAALNEKRDSYDGITNSVKWIISHENPELCKLLQDGLFQNITSYPMRYAGKMFISKCQHRLIDEVPNFVIELSESIILDSAWQAKFTDDSEILKLQITCVKAIKKALQVSGSRPTIIKDFQFDQLCTDAIFSGDDSTKIDTLSLTLESKSTTKPLEEKELNQFKLLFQTAISLQDPALRQIFIALTGKLLRRLKDSQRVIARDKKAYTDVQRKLINERYVQFLTWLIQFCFDSIYCNAYFGSFILTISTLNLIIQHITFSDDHLPIEHLYCTKRCYDSVLSCLNDSFEENKSRALDLLLSLPSNQQFLNQHNLDCFEQLAYQLVGSVNPAHSLTCQYIFKLVIGLGVRMGYKTKNQLLIHHLNRLTDLVEEGLRDTQEDFVSALKQKPIYPKLSCIRALLGDIDIAYINETRIDWERLSQRIVVGSMEACKAVSTIVCNLNPETIGHLPMDLKPVDAETLTKTLNVSLKITDSDINIITSQMLLISGWKTIKECSLALGAMCNRFWWPKEPDNKKRKNNCPGRNIEPILSSSQIIEIIGFFDHYLRNLRHRGAFEQAYNGFMMVTRRVWQDESYKRLLVKTLQDIMTDFKNTAIDEKKAECLKAYVTRRSAGLPFIVQAILNSEDKHDSKAFRWVVDCLFEVLESGNTELYQRIHCLNILRALVKEHFLGEKILPYIGKTFEITMDSFESDSFPIRNCANMLLKAIVDRTFGVNRLKHNIHRRNQLSFERFFTECPNLHAKMLNHLHSGLRDKRSLAAVHSVFIVLFRLVPSLCPGPDYSADKIVAPFIPPIAQLAIQCPDFKLRELAAKLKIRLDMFHKGFSRADIDRCLENTNQATDMNKLHGTLAILRNLVENTNQNHEVMRDCKLFEYIPQLICRICLADLKQYSVPIKLVAIELGESYCLNCPSGESSEWMLDLIPAFENWCETQDHFDDPMYENLIFKTITVLLMGLVHLQTRDNFIFDKNIHIDGLYTNHLAPVIKIMFSVIKAPPGSTFSYNLQAALIRLIRQVLDDNVPDCFIKKLLSDLDIDSTAAHVTPYDRVEAREENDAEKDKLLSYCHQPNLKRYLKNCDLMSILLKGADYSEFCQTNGKFSSNKSNTPRSIELMALVCKNWDILQMDRKEISFGKGPITKLDFITDYVNDLPDCDVRCVAILCAARVLLFEFNSSPKSVSDLSQIHKMEQFCQLIDDLTDGDHSLTVRESCCQLLSLTLKRLIEIGSKELQECLVHLLSALIKLSQDEENAVRLAGRQIILSLNDRSPRSNSRHISASSGTEHVEELAIGSRLNNLISLITDKLFDPNIEGETDRCLGLLMRIVFNHAKNYSNDVNEEKERLFDKTKLNTFADHVATISSSLEGLKRFFGRQADKNKSLNSLRLPAEVLYELRIVDKPTEDNTGDYSWRLKKVIKGLSEKRTEMEESNELIFGEFLENLADSLRYFSAGYRNVLTDTEYTYHELSLYKRMAFAKFVLSCTNYEVRNKNSLRRIRDSIKKITETTCCTTLLYKCGDLIDLETSI